MVTNKEYVPSGHFYSPIPSCDNIEDLYKKVGLPTGIAINDTEQVALFNEFRKYISIMPFSCGIKNNNRYFFNGENWYAYGDAAILFCMINHFKPKRYIEIGSGYSSVVALDSCEFAELETDITFIEPYPDLVLGLLNDTDDAEKLVIKNIAQDTDLTLFDSLQSGDILFIDSSHVVKFASDVLFIISEVLPRLNPGVIIHFHDIFWPFEYPIDWLKEGRAWNEAYMLKAMLINNNNYEILYFDVHPELLKEKMPDTETNFGCGLWLRKN